MVVNFLTALQSRIHQINSSHQMSSACWHSFPLAVWISCSTEDVFSINFNQYEDHRTSDVAEKNTELREMWTKLGKTDVKQTEKRSRRELRQSFRTGWLKRKCQRKILIKCCGYFMDQFKTTMKKGLDCDKFTEIHFNSYKWATKRNIRLMFGLYRLY